MYSLFLSSKHSSSFPSDDPHCEQCFLSRPRHDHHDEAGSMNATQSVHSVSMNSRMLQHVLDYNITSHNLEGSGYLSTARFKPMSFCVCQFLVNCSTRFDNCCPAYPTLIHDTINRVNEYCLHSRLWASSSGAYPGHGGRRRKCSTE